MNVSKLFTDVSVGALTLRNRIVMSPMTRCRAIGNIPNALMATYYGQRAAAGLIITEGTSPSPNGLGYARIPGIFNQAQVDGWRLITDAVHQHGGKIIVQLMHTGRISHALNMPEGAEILAPSAVQAAGQMWTDAAQMQNFGMPKAMTTGDLTATRVEFVQAAKNAIAAGFDGVELHGANGYLLEQFLSPHANVRTDEYGGSIENRCRFVLEVVKGVADEIGRERTGIRLSPFGVSSDMKPYPETHDAYAYLSSALNDLGIAYIHLVDHSAMGAPPVPAEMKQAIRENFKNTIILAGGFDGAKAEAAIESKLGDLVGFGRPFINNPDLVDRLKNNWPLSTILHADLFYGATEKGYTDYPNYK